MSSMAGKHMGLSHHSMSRTVALVVDIVLSKRRPLLPVVGVVSRSTKKRVRLAAWLRCRDEATFFVYTIFDELLFQPRHARPEPDGNRCLCWGRFFGANLGCRPLQLCGRVFQSTINGRL